MRIHTGLKNHTTKLPRIESVTTHLYEGRSSNASVLFYHFIDRLGDILIALSYLFIVYAYKINTANKYTRQLINLTPSIRTPLF